MMPENAWFPTPADLSLDPGRIEVWRFSVDESDHVVQGCYQILSDEERRRADRFRIPAKRAEFILGRAVMRRALGVLLHIAPSDLPIEYNPHGKPMLAAAGSLQTVAFNLSHAGRWGLFALTPDRRLGIDIQDIDPRTNCEQLAGRFFSRLESETLLSLPASERRAAFFRCWTRKEAFLKAIGRGIALGLDTFDVSLAPEEAPRLIEARFDRRETTSRWRFCDLNVDEHYAAALAADRPPFSIRHFDWRWPE